MASARYRGRIIVNNTDYTGSFVTPNPSEPPTKDLNTLEIEAEVFNIAGGGGSSVIPNPSGTATENLYTVNIDGTIYDIKSGNGNFKTKVLLNQAATSGTYSLADDYTNYDLLAFWTTGQGYESGEAGVVVMMVDDLKKAQAENRVLTMFGYYNRYYNFYITPSQFTVQGRNDMTVVKIVGYKIYADCYNPIIYSTEEREIGVWINNKPLYQKTLVFENYTNGTYQDVSSLNIEEVVNNFGEHRLADYSYGLSFPYYENNNWYSLMTFDKNNGRYCVYCSSQMADTYKKLFITIQYTKTTDVAGSGSYTTLGVPAHHYDGNEKVVGTYFGETLYERTLNFTQDNQLYYIPNTTYVKKLVKHNGECTKDNFDYQIPYYDGSDYLSVGNDSNGVRIYSSNYFVGAVYELTIEYTKTTD